MLTTLAISGYRSLRNVVVPLRALNVITGPSGSGKTGIWKVVRLLHDCATGRAAWPLTVEGGLQAITWAGPETGAGGRRYEHAVPQLADGCLRLGFATTEVGYAVEFASQTEGGEPEIALETLWRGQTYDPAGVIEEHRGVPLTGSLLAAQGSPLGAVVGSWQTQFGVVDLPKLPAELQKAREADPVAFDAAVSDAFPGARAAVENGVVQFYEHGLRRPLGALEISSGAREYLKWICNLLSPELPPLILALDPGSLAHPDLHAPLARLLAKAAARTQLIVFTHSPHLLAALEHHPESHLLELEKNFGETVIDNLEEEPAWRWPVR